MSNIEPPGTPQPPGSSGSPVPPSVPQQPPMPPNFGAAPTGYGAHDPSAPYGRHPLTGEAYSDKSKLTAGLLELFLGGVGAGRWYLGNTGLALGQLFTCGGCGIWALIDAIQMLTGNVRDKNGRPLHD
jgi:TM2 domain